MFKKNIGEIAKIVLERLLFFIVSTIKLIYYYLLEILGIVAIALSFKFDSKIVVYLENLIGIPLEIPNEIIIVLFPTILTALSIVLSLSDQMICGINLKSFRKLAGNKIYSLTVMFLIGISIFSIYTSAIIIEKDSTIVTLSIISIVYGVWFSFQEIPLLLKDERRIIQIVRNAYKNKLNLQYINDLNDVLTSLIFTKGMRYVYNILKTNRLENNKEMLEYLLSLQNDFLWKYLDNTSKNNVKTFGSYKNADIFSAVETLIMSIEDIISLPSDMNILEIYQNEEKYYHITRSIFSLNRILEQLDLDAKYEKLADIFTNISMSINTKDEKKKAFYYKILNALLINSASDEEIWFLELLRDYTYREGRFFGGSTEYLIFIACYIYYLIDLEDGVSKEFKEKLKKFIAETPKRNKSYAATSFKQQLKYRLSYFNVTDYDNLLNELMFIYESNNTSAFWYNRPSGVVYTTSIHKTFSKKILINWWLGMLLTDEMLHSHNWNEHEKPSLSNLSSENMYIFATTLNETWFEDDELNTKVDIPYFSLYGLKSKLDSYMNHSEITIALREFRNDYFYKRMQNEFVEHRKTDEIFNKYLSLLKKSFNKATTNIPFVDESLECENSKKMMFTFRCDTRWSDSLIKQYVEDMPQFIQNFIYEYFKEYAADNNLVKKITQYDSKILNKIIGFEPDYKFAYIHDYIQSEDNYIMVNKINMIKTLDSIRLPRDTFIKQGAFKMKFAYNEEESFVRKFTEDEVNQIVDRDYKLINGLYKYEEGVNGNNTAFITREQIQKLVFEKFFISCIVFTFKIEIKENKLLYFQKD